MPVTPKSRTEPAAPGNARNSARHRVTAGHKLLLRFIHEGGFQSGDHLPPQSDLRKQLGLTNYVLSAAMQEMVSAGMLTRQRRTGTLVANLNARSQERWTIGLTVPSADTRQTVPFFPQLLHHLQAALSDFNCRPVT